MPVLHLILYNCTLSSEETVSLTLPLQCFSWVQIQLAITSTWSANWSLAQWGHWVTFYTRSPCSVSSPAACQPPQKQWRAAPLQVNIQLQQLKRAPLTQISPAISQSSYRRDMPEPLHYQTHYSSYHKTTFPLLNGAFIHSDTHANWR